MKTEPPSVIYDYSYKGSSDNDITMANDCASTGSSVEPSTGQQTFDNDVNRIETATANKLDSINTLVYPLCLQTNVTCKNGQTRFKTVRKKCVYTRRRKSKATFNDSLDNKRETLYNSNINDKANTSDLKATGKDSLDIKGETVNDFNINDEANDSDVIKCETDETVTEENDSLILFTDVPEVSKPKASSEAVNMSCESCGFSWKKLKCFKKHICKKVCPFCNKVFPHGRTGNFNKHVNFHILKAKKVSVTIANGEGVNHTQSERNIAGESSTLKQDPFKSQIQLENELPVTQENLTPDKAKDKLDAEKDTTKFHCQVCNLSFRRKKVYDTHSCKKICPFCNKEFPLGRRENFDKHVKFHEDLIKKKALVKIANSLEVENHSQTKGIMVSSSSDAKQECLESQIQSEDILPETKGKLKAEGANTEPDEEEDPTNLQCPVCNHTFQNKKKFNKHRNSNSCKRVCEYCGKIFLRRQICKYTTHIKTHTKQKDHKCTICGKYFYEKDYMRRHQRKVHGGERPFVCELCGASFIWAGGKSYATKSVFGDFSYFGHKLGCLYYILKVARCLRFWM